MYRTNIITGQHTPAKRELAKQFRQQMTPSERILWQRLRANRLNGWQFRRQQIIDGFIADFYCHAVGLIIEVDGPIHNTNQEYDTERDAILSARGLCILRFTNAQVETALESVLAAITTEIEQIRSS